MEDAAENLLGTMTGDELLALLPRVDRRTLAGIYENLSTNALRMVFRNGAEVEIRKAGPFIKRPGEREFKFYEGPARVCVGPPACLLDGAARDEAERAENCVWCNRVTLHEDGSRTQTGAARA